MDGQREPALWQTAEPGDEWTPAFCLGGAGTPPWKQMKKSRLPKAIERPVTASLIWRGHTVRTRWDVRVQNLAHTLCRNEIEGQAVTRQPEQGFCSTEEENLFVFDCGKTSYTSVTVEVGRLTGNVRIELFYDIAFEGRPATHSAFPFPATTRFCKRSGKHPALR